MSSVNLPAASCGAALSNALAHLIGASFSEVYPTRPCDPQAALSFAWAWALMRAQGLLLWSMPDHLLAEHGAPYAEGLAQFGADLGRTLFARAQTQSDALWAAEQALSIPGATALCVITPSPKSLSLTATRRLLLLTEKHHSRCVLVRLDTPTSSAAGLRFSVQSAPSDGVCKELGPASFHARLTRNRTGPVGQSWRLNWSPHALALAALDVDLVSPVFDRSVEPRRRRAS